MESTDRGHTLIYQNRYLYSKRSPAARPETIAGSASIEPRSLVILPSPLLFYGVDELVSRSPEDCHILCVEIDQKLMAASMKHAEPALLTHDRITYVRTEGIMPLLRTIDDLGDCRFRRVVSLPLSGGYQLNKDLYDALISAAEAHIQRQWQNRATLMHMARLWIKNLFSNLSRYSGDLPNLLPRPQKPVLVAGAGDSLECALPLLERFAERLFILAVDTALPTLLSQGIVPDAVLVLEAQVANSYDFLGHGGLQISLICDLTSHPSVLRHESFNRSFILTEFAACGLLDRLKASPHAPSILRPMGSVGVAAVDLALQLSAGAVLLTGLDFSYVPGKPHARGAPSHAITLGTSYRISPTGWYGESQKRPIIQGLDVRGNALSSDVVLYSYGMLLAGSLAEQDRVYDLRNGGVPLNIPTIADEDALEKLLEKAEAIGASAASREGSHAPVDTPAVLDFLSNERNLLMAFLNAFDRSRSDPAIIQSTLEAVDYIYLDFPDSERSSTLSDDFLVRCAASASSYLEHVNNAIAVVSN